MKERVFLNEQVWAFGRMQRGKAFAGREEWARHGGGDPPGLLSTGEVWGLL